MVCCGFKHCHNSSQVPSCGTKNSIRKAWGSHFKHMIDEKRPWELHTIWGYVVFHPQTRYVVLWKAELQNRNVNGSPKSLHSHPWGTPAVLQNEAPAKSGCFVKGLSGRLQEQNGHLFGVRMYHPEFRELFRYSSWVTYLLTNDDESPVYTFAKEKRELMHSSCWEVYWEQQCVVYVRDKDLCMRRITCSWSPGYSEYANLNNVVSSGS